MMFPGSAIAPNLAGDRTLTFEETLRRVVAFDNTLSIVDRTILEAPLVFQQKVFMCHMYTSRIILQSRRSDMYAEAGDTVL